MMFLAQIDDEDIRAKICENLVAFMMLDGGTSGAIKEQIKEIYIEAFGTPKNLMMLDTPSKETLKAQFCEILGDYPFGGEKSVVKKILFELLSCALCDGTYSDNEREVILHIAEKFEIDDTAFLEEMQGHIDTILALDKQCKAIIFSERM